MFRGAPRLLWYNITSSEVSWRAPLQIERKTLLPLEKSCFVHIRFKRNCIQYCCFILSIVIRWMLILQPIIYANGKSSARRKTCYPIHSWLETSHPIWRKINECCLEMLTNVATKSRANRNETNKHLKICFGVFCAWIISTTEAKKLLKSCHEFPFLKADVSPN